MAAVRTSYCPIIDTTLLYYCCDPFFFFFALQLFFSKVPPPLSRLWIRPCLQQQGYEAYKHLTIRLSRPINV